MIIFVKLTVNLQAILDLSPFIFVGVKSRWLHRRARVGSLIVGFAM
jgi:hypothetical protein